MSSDGAHIGAWRIVSRSTFRAAVHRLAPVMVLVAAIVVASAALAADHVIKLAHPNRNDPFDNATAAMAVVFKSLVEAGSGGTLQVDIYPEGQLGQDDATVALVGKGIIQSAISSVGGIARIYPLIGALDLPFAYPTISSTYPVFDGPFGQRLAHDIGRRTGLHVLGFGDSGGFFAITNSVRRIASPADVTGLKIRTMGLETHKLFVRSLGGQPIGLPWSEVYTGLATGVADGQMNPLPIIRFARLDEVQKHLTLTNHFFTPYIWVMTRDFWTALTAEQQAVVDNAVRSAIVAGRGLSRIIESSERGLPALKQRMSVHVPNDAETAAFRQATQPAIKSYIETTFGQDGIDLMNDFLAAIRAANQF
jgi:tripartite ATP-independent transporter DctP family solute receptor